MLRWRRLIGMVVLAGLASSSALPDDASPPLFAAPIITQPTSRDIRSVAIVMTGDQGWTPALTDFVRRLSELDALVVGLDIAAAKARVAAAPGLACLDLAGALTQVAHDAEATSGVKSYIQPLLIGSGSGATLVYAALLQAPPDTFKGGFSLGFCRDVAMPKAFCPSQRLTAASREANGVTTFGKVDRVPAPWTLIDGITPSCVGTSVATFAQGTDGAAVVTSDPKDPFDTFSDAYLPIAGSDFSFRAGKTVEDLSGLPLTEIRLATAPTTDTFVVFLSGDGGWAELDQEVSQRLAASGLPVVGVSSLRYFWTKRDPDRIAHDVARIVKHYAETWHKTRFILAGFSFGAEAVPFAAIRLRGDTRDALAGVALLSPGLNASFLFHISGWLGQDEGSEPTRPEIDKITGVPVLCIFGREADDNLCPLLKGANVTATGIGADHHFDENYDAVARAVVAMWGKPRAP